jgi:long-chain acyl-CoA synthetase
MLDQIARHRASHMFIVLTQARAIVDNVSSKDADFRGLACVITAGAPMPLALKDGMRDLICKKLYELWGFSGSVGTIIAPEEMRQRPESVGRLWAASELRIIDNNDGDITDCGQSEIVGSTTSNMHGYLNRDEANREIAWYDEFHRLYLRTGDIGELDEDGYLTLRERKKDMILSGGLKVFPIDIGKNFRILVPMSLVIKVKV